MIPLFRHNIGPDDIDNCVKVLKSNWHTSGPVNQEVEKLIQDYYGGAKAALTSSCTSGLMAIALAIGLKSGDEVLVPAMTFTATAASVMHSGAKPVFVDIDPNTGLIDIDQIESKITSKTKAIYVVNLYGHIPDIQKIKSIADKYNLFLLEDCAHAFDARRDGYLPATFSDAAVYSFYATKTIHCGEGGAVISKDANLIDKVKVIRRHGLSKWPQPGEPGNIGYNVIDLGFKGTLSDIHASLLISQVEKADEYRLAREKIAHKYVDAFKDLENIESLNPDDNVQSSWYTFPTRISSQTKRSLLMNMLNHDNVGYTVMYKTLEEFDLYQTGITCPEALKLGQTQLSLPCYPKLTEEEQDKIIKIVRNWNSCF